MEHRHDDDRARDTGAAAPCPLCLIRDVAAGTRPDVVAHLLAAGRELARAVEKALDGHAAAHRDGAAAAPAGDRTADPAGDRTADEPPGPPPRLRRIPVE